MSEITVTLPKSRYDSMEADLKKLREQVIHLEHLLKSEEYYVKTIRRDQWNSTSEIYYRPLEPNEIDISLTAKFNEEKERYITEIRKLNVILERKNKIISDLTPTVSTTYTTTLYHSPKPKKKPWWKLF
jgi:hypothetical protein